MKGQYKEEIIDPGQGNCPGKDNAGFADQLPIGAYK